MTTVGDTLRRERIQRKLDLDQISHELKISRRMLDAIEADQYERLPGGVFAKAFVRQYAGMLGLDAEELASQVQRAMAPPSSLDTEEPAKPALNPIEVPGSGSKNGQRSATEVDRRARCPRRCSSWWRC